MPERRRLGAREQAEMVAWSLALPLLKRFVPLRRLAGVMWTPATRPRSAARERAVVSFSARVTRMRPTRRSNCLERSLLAFRFLARGGAEPRLVVGVAAADGGVLGHAWVLVDGEPVHDGRATIDGFAPLVEFGAGGEATELAGRGPLPDRWS